MTGSDVVVEIAPADAGSPNAAILIAACSGGVSAGRCVLGSDGPEREAPRAVAIVTWDGPDRRAAHIEVGLRRAERGEWISRDLRFGPGDDRAETWRSVGLAIATLVGEVAPLRGGSEGPSAPTLPLVATPPRTGAEGKSGGGVRSERAGRDENAGRPVAWIDANVVAGPGLDRGPWRVGGSIAGSYSPGRGPWFAVLAARHAARPTDERGVAARWTSAWAGAGASVRIGGAFRLEADLGPVVEAIGATATEPATGRTDGETRWTAGARAGGRASWAGVPPVGVVVGADATWAARGSTVRLHGEEVGATPFVAWAILAGARVSF